MNKIHERGQATMEVAAALVAIVFLAVGFFTLGGIGITGIKSLLLTRFAAENAAASAISGRDSGTQISNWEYSSAKYNDTEYVIPFLAGDYASRTLIYANGSHFDESDHSLSLHPEDIPVKDDGTAVDAEAADYVFAGFGDLPGTVIPGAVISGNSTALASLHVKGAVMPDGTENEPNYLFRKERGKVSWRDSLRTHGWIGADRIRIEDWPSSTVAFPAFGPRK